MFETIKEIVTDLRAFVKGLTHDSTDGKPSYTKCGTIIGGFVFSYKIIVLPDPTPEMMLVYMGTVGGYSLFTKYLASKYGKGPVAEEEEPK